MHFIKIIAVALSIAATIDGRDATIVISGDGVSYTFSAFPDQVQSMQNRIFGYHKFCNQFIPGPPLDVPTAIRNFVEICRDANEFQEYAKKHHWGMAGLSIDPEYRIARSYMNEFSDTCDKAFQDDASNANDWLQKICSRTPVALAALKDEQYTEARAYGFRKRQEEKGEEKGNGKKRWESFKA